MARTRSDTISWLGCGCGSLVFLALAAIVGLTWFGYRQGKEMERNFEDPATRTAKAREILPWRELPPGYHPMGSFSVPLLMDMAIFSDRAPDPRRRVKRDRDSAFEKSGLFYMEFHPWVSDKDELLRWLRGESKEAPGWIRRSQAQMDPEAVAHRGTLEVGGRTITYAVGRGSANGDGAEAEPEPDPRRQRRSPEQDGLMTFFALDCGDDRARMGVWFGPDPAPAKPVTEIDLTGTVGDPARIQEFLGHFEPCG
ncbi:MAG TPA: hypothetical protein VJ885_14300 [Thermoanaerobaculia bacterium]|nr:hypothetical protein [Thermoanaerobaculia bacterium]